MKLLSTLAIVGVTAFSITLTSCNDKETKTTPTTPAVPVKAEKVAAKVVKPAVKVEKPVAKVIKPAVKVVEKTEAVWLTDFEAAKKLAKKENKKIFIDFSGSDWCHWCVKLDNEVFKKPEFIKYANEKLVLFMADFPRQKAQSAEVKKQNQALMQKYGVRGFPTIIILDSSAKKVAQMSYQPGGSAKYVESIKKTLSK